MRCFPLRVLLVAMGSSLAACNAAVDPIFPGDGCPEMPIRGPEKFANVQPEAVIDDFEDGNLKVVEVAGRTGAWYSFPGGTQAAAGQATTRCVARGLRSGHFIVTSSAADVGTGMNWNVSFDGMFPNVLSYDASPWSGFSFWIASGDIADAATEMVVGVNTPEVLAGNAICTVCGDYHRVTIPLTRNWTRWSIRFDQLKQDGTGQPPVPLLPKEHLMNFIFWPKNPFDIWIDDLRFEP